MRTYRGDRGRGQGAARAAAGAPGRSGQAPRAAAEAAGADDHAVTRLPPQIVGLQEQTHDRDNP